MSLDLTFEELRISNNEYQYTIKYSVTSAINDSSTTFIHITGASEGTFRNPGAPGENVTLSDILVNNQSAIINHNGLDLSDDEAYLSVYQHDGSFFKSDDSSLTSGGNTGTIATIKTNGSLRDNYTVIKLGETYKTDNSAITVVFVDALPICISEDQDILLDNGYKNIKDVKIGDTINGNKILKVFEITNTLPLVLFKVVLVKIYHHKMYM